MFVALAKVDRSIWVTLTGWALLVLFTWTVGPLLLLLVPCVGIWLLYSLVLMWRRPEVRRLQRTKMLICVVMLAIAGCGPWYVHQSSRSSADRIVSKLQIYRAAHGRYPGVLADIGETDGPGGYPKGITYGVDSEGAPSLVYFSTFAPFDVWDYDFSEQRWQYLAD